MKQDEICSRVLSAPSEAERVRALAAAFEIAPQLARNSDPVSATEIVPCLLSLTQPTHPHRTSTAVLDNLPTPTCGSSTATSARVASTRAMV